MQHPYWLDTKHIVIATMHGKETLIWPVLQSQRDCSISVPESFNTDRFGTFSGERVRTDTQQKTAALKAKKACDITGASMAIWSEWAFFSDWPMWLATCNLECLVLVDTDHDLEITAWARNYQVKSHRLQSSQWEEVEAYLLDPHTDFPNHWILIRPESYNRRHYLFTSTWYRAKRYLTKWIQTLDDAKHWFELAQVASSTWRVLIEYDFRSQYHPTRQETISQAAHELVQRIQSSCPSCSSPWRWTSWYLGQAACLSCHAPTNYPTHEVWSCPSCLRAEAREIAIDNELIEKCVYCHP